MDIARARAEIDRRNTRTRRLVGVSVGGVLAFVAGGVLGLGAWFLLVGTAFVIELLWIVRHPGAKDA